MSIKDVHGFTVSRSMGLKLEEFSCGDHAESIYYIRRVKEGTTLEMRYYLPYRNHREARQWFEKYCDDLKERTALTKHIAKLGAKINYEVYGDELKCADNADEAYFAFVSYADNNVGRLAKQCADLAETIRKYRVEHFPN